jgi:hypothetical protein
MTVLLRVLAAVGLVADAVIHLQLAPAYQLSDPGGIGQGNLFRISAAVSALAAVYVLGSGSRRSFVTAAVVALSGVAAVLVYRFVDVPQMGPIPAMYEPVWFPSKSLSAVTEGLVGVLALVGAAFQDWKT